MPRRKGGVVTSLRILGLLLCFGALSVYWILFKHERALNEDREAATRPSLLRRPPAAATTGARERAGSSESSPASPPWKCVDPRYDPTDVPLCDDVDHVRTGFDDCGFSFTKDAAYLPDPAWYACVRERPPTRWAADAAAMHARIDRAQNPARCDEPLSTDTTAPAWRQQAGGSGKGSIVPSRVVSTKGGKPKWHVVRWMAHGHGSNLWYMIWTAGNHFDRGVPVLASNSQPVRSHKLLHLDAGVLARIAENLRGTLCE